VSSGYPRLSPVPAPGGLAGPRTTHAAISDGRDDYGREMPTSAYFQRLQGNGPAFTRMPTPRFHETGTAKLLLALAVLSMMAAAYQWRIRTMRARERELTALVDARTAELRQHGRDICCRERERCCSVLLYHRLRAR